MLLDVGHTCSVTVFRSSGSRLLTQDQCGHWVLWDNSTTAQIASGTASCLVSNCVSVDLAGSTAVIQTGSGLELRAATDGTLISTITGYGSWWKLATDGSYIVAGGGTGLSTWTPSGQPAATRPGNYSPARAFAAPGAVRVALGPAGSTAIETVVPTTGASTTSPTFSGQFHSWFLDGNRFLTNTGNTVWVYSKDAVQEGLLALPSIESLTGQGQWLWTHQSSSVGRPVKVYAVGGTVAGVTTYSNVDWAVPSGMTVGLFYSDVSAASEAVLDLSGTTPNLGASLPAIPYPTGFAASSPSQWLIGTQRGVIREGGVTVPGGSRSFGCGRIQGITGGGNRVSIAAAVGTINTLNVNTRATENVIAFASSHVQMSADGTVLAASATSSESQYQPDRTLKLFSLPGGSELRTWPSAVGTPPYLFDFVLAASGTVIGQVLLTPGLPWNLTRTVMGTQASSPTWSDTIQEPASSGDPAPLRLSPDGTLIAAGTGSRSSPTALGMTLVTNVYRDGVLITAVPGLAVAWLDNERLLVSKYIVAPPQLPVYSGAAIHDTTGATLATLASLPDIRDAQVVSASVIYSPKQNKTYSMTTGAAIWTTPETSTSVGAVAGSQVVFSIGNQILIKPL